MHLGKPLAKTWLALALCAAFLAPANAQSAFGDNWYFGGGLSALDWKGDFDSSHIAVHLVGGVPLGEHLDAEVRLGFGLGGDELPDLKFLKAGIDTVAAIGLRAGVPIGDALRPYLALGLSSVKTDKSLDVGILDIEIDGETNDDIFYGIGAGWRFGQGHELTVEFSSYLDKDDIEISGFSMRFTTSF